MISKESSETHKERIRIAQIEQEEAQTSTFATEWFLDPGEFDRLVQRLLLLAVLAECHDAVQLLVVLTARLATELVDFILKDGDRTKG